MPPYGNLGLKGGIIVGSPPTLVTSLKKRDLAWARARKSKLEADRIIFCQLRNKCTSLIKKAKSEYYISETTKNLNNPRKFWNVVRSVSDTTSSTELPNFLVKDSVHLSDKNAMLDYFNEHFITAGHLFNSFNGNPKRANGTVERPAVSPPADYSFNFDPVAIADVRNALQRLDSKKSAGPDGLDPFFLKLAADVIAEPLASIFNLSLCANKLPKVWKSAFILPLLKGGDSSAVNNYRLSPSCVSCQKCLNNWSVISWKTS